MKKMHLLTVVNAGMLTTPIYKKEKIHDGIFTL